jgi:hypothetical protein
MIPIERVSQVSQTKPWHGEIPTYYLYTLGISGERFFREIKDNARLMGTRCPHCHLIYVPPRLYCERCFTELKEWLEVGSRGKVYTYTIAHIALDGSPLEEPVILAMVKIDDTDGGLLHKLGEVSPKEVRIGLGVEAVFKDKAERVGSIWDIKYFKPI